MIPLVAFAAIGRASVALSEQCFTSSLETFERAYRLNAASFKAFCTGPLAATQAAVMGASAASRGVRALHAVEPWTHTGEICRALVGGLPGLVAEYAADMRAPE